MLRRFRQIIGVRRCATLFSVKTRCEPDHSRSLRVWGCSEVHMANGSPTVFLAETYNFNRGKSSMKGFGVIGILVTAVIGITFYMYTLKQAAPGPGMVATQAIDVVGVKNDLVAIAQAERMYYTQNGSYADLSTLTTTGTMNLARTSRDGYTYSATPSGGSFTV